VSAELSAGLVALSADALAALGVAARLSSAPSASDPAAPPAAPAAGGWGERSMWGEESAPQRARAPAEGVRPPGADGDSPLVVTAAVDLGRLSATLALPVRGAAPDCLTLDALGIAVRHCSLPGGMEQTHLRVQRHYPARAWPGSAGLRDAAASAAESFLCAQCRRKPRVPRRARGGGVTALRDVGQRRPARVARGARELPRGAPPPLARRPWLYLPHARAMQNQGVRSLGFGAGWGLGFRV
jgi:hypothetical protein